MKKICIVGASGKLGQYMVQHALDRADGNVTTAAQLLDLPRSTLRSKLDRK